VVVRVPVYYAPQALYYVQQSPMLSPHVYVSPSSQIYTPVAVSQLPQFPVPQVALPHVAVPQVAVAQRPVTRFSVAQANPVPQVSLLRVSIPPASQVVAAQEPKVMVPQQPLSKTEDKTPVSIKQNRPESVPISDSLSYESSEEEESSSYSEYSSDSDTDDTSDSETVENIQVQFNEQMDLQANDDLAFAFQLEDVLNQDAPPQNIYQKYSSFDNDKIQPQEPPFSIEEIQHLYREGEPVHDYINFYVAISPHKADDLIQLMENEVSSQSILQNVRQYYQERDPYPVDDESFIIDYLTSSEDEGQEI